MSVEELSPRDRAWLEAKHDAYETRLAEPAGLVCVDPPKPLVLDETWTAIEQPQASECLPSIWCGKEEIAVIYEAEAMVGHQNARARLASAAPDMVRVLLACEWAWCEGREWKVCPSCSNDEPNDSRRSGHALDCALDACLRKAGVR